MLSAAAAATAAAATAGLCSKNCCHLMLLLLLRSAVRPEVCTLTRRVGQQLGRPWSKSVTPGRRPYLATPIDYGPGITAWLSSQNAWAAHVRRVESLAQPFSVILALPTYWGRRPQPIKKGLPAPVRLYCPPAVHLLTCAACALRPLPSKTAAWQAAGPCARQSCPPHKIEYTTK